jgi:hypothetical protein
MVLLLIPAEMKVFPANPTPLPVDSPMAPVTVTVQVSNAPVRPSHPIPRLANLPA